MRKLYILLILVLGPLVTVLAQPTILVGNNGTACNDGVNDAFCVPVTSQDFTNINSLEFDFGYDPAVLNFTGAQNFHPDMQAGNGGNLGPALFDGTVPGIISFGVWETGDCGDPANIGVTLDDDVDVLFELCFEAIGNYGDQSRIGVNASPTPRSTRNATQCNNIGVFRQDGGVTLCVRELIITAADVTGNEGDQVCVDFTVEGFDGLNGIQFTVNYDDSFLSFVNLFPNTEIPANTLGAYGLPGNGSVDPGEITVAWSYTITDPPNVSVADGTTMFTACFDIQGACETSTEITFSGDPTPIEANNDDPDNPTESSVVPITLVPGTVAVNDCDPEGIEIKIDCGDPVNLGDIVCVEFQAGSNFDAVRRLEYLMTWNPNILQFQSVDDPNNLSGLSAANFDTSNISNGVLGLDWEFIAGPPQNMDNMELIYRVCFEVVGVGGDSPIQIITPGIGVSNGVNIGINPTNCVVQVNQPESVVVDFGNIAVPLGGSDCVPVTVSNFTNVLSTQFTMNWDESIWLHNGTIQNENPALAGATVTYTPVGLASMGFQMDNGTDPITLTDGSVLFEICFDTAPTANPGECDELTTVGLPFAESAITSTSNGDNIGLIINPGDLCILFPEGFGMTAVSTSGGWLDTVCMDFTVESFDNITAADFNINWDPTALQFVSSSTLAWNDLTLTLAMPDVGTLNGTFTSGTPVAIPDGEVAFQVCFLVIGDPNECYPVTIQDSPAPEVQTSNGQGSMVITNGEICSEERIVVTDLNVVPPSCPGACDGEITITVASWDGQGFIGTTWTTENPDFQQFDPLMLDEVCEGMTIYRIFDVNSGVFLQDTLFIESDGVVPNAVIEGDDPRELDCTNLVLLCAEDQGAGFNYLWYQNSVGGMPFGDQQCVLADSPAEYILQVVNEVSGCTATDTVTVTAPELPVAIIDPVDMGITCFVDSIQLNGDNSMGENLVYDWFFFDNALGEFVSIGSGAQINVGEPGRYRLQVTNTVTQCTNSIDDEFDEVIIADDRIRPVACVQEVSGGSAVQEQNCDGTPIEFSGDCTNSPGQIITYYWYEYDEVADTIIEPAAIVSLNFSASDIGLYAMIALNEETGCTDTSFAEIIPNSSAPQVQLDEPAAIDCNDPSVVLNATIIPNDPTFTFEWTESNGGTLTDTNTLNPTATSPGTFTITVTNPENGCTASAAVAVADETELPEVEITTDDLEINCFPDSQEAVIRTTAMVDGDLVVQWYQDSISVASEIMGANGDTLTVANAGIYIIQVSNPGTGCAASDTTEVFGQFETPTLTLDMLTPTVNCDNPTVTVTGTVTNSTDFTVGEWMSPDGGNIVAITNGGLTVEVDAMGTYVLIVTSNVSGCTTEQDFVVSEDFAEPTVNVTGDMLTLDCTNNEQVTLDGTGSSVGQDFTYLWENQDGAGPDNPTMLQTTTSTPGTYLLTVTNNDNGCTSDTMVVVSIDTIAPVATIAPVDPLSCAEPSATLTVDVAMATEFIVEWAPPVSPDDQVSVDVTAPGTYSVRVVSTINGCEDTAEVTVDGDVTSPPVTFAPVAAFDCGDESVLIDASASGEEDDFDLIEWTINMVPIPGENSLMLNATEPGEYSLRLIAASNGCDSTGLITVEIANPLTLPELPTLNLDFLACDGSPVTIDASATGDPMDFSSIEWTGGDFTEVSEFVIDAQEAGDYTLSVVLDSPVDGCENSMVYTVVPDPDTPVADAGADQVAGCGQPATLDGSASTPPAANISYEWVGTPTLVDVNAVSPEASEAGMYQLIVTNTNNGCADTSEVVTVTFEFPDDANAGADAAACDDIFDLSGNLPTNGDNITGVWTTATGAVIDMPNSPVTMVSGLQEGANSFVWTLSATGCPEFSSDEVIITSAAAPVANEDFLDIEADELGGEVSLIANDLFGGSTNFDLTILEGPIFGTYDTAALDLGTFVLNLMPSEFGTSVVTYQLCSTDCPDLCDTSTLTITVAQSENPFVPNTVTPNGDGANDDLVFDIITFSDPDDIPDNELIIFNRWGDIIYEAKPYTNNWNGLNQDGQPVPEGTYYYVLRLNISRGEIIRGDITVIR